MRSSIRLRVIIALNIFALCLTLVFGWIARETAGEIVEERFAKEMVEGVSRFLSKKGFPYSDSMMGYLREIFNAEWVVMENKTANIIASSLEPAQKAEFVKDVKGIGISGAILLGDKKYRMDFSDVSVLRFNTEKPASCRLYMLVPYSIFQEARNKATSRVARFIIIAVGAATILAILFAFTITRPIRRLASEMDLFTDKDPSDTKNLGISDSQGPSEIVRLSKSFHNLMERLASARAELAQNERLATLGKVLLSVAHELRNPLSGIKMNVRVLKDGIQPSSPDIKGVETILREIDRMELYLNELMSLSPDSPPIQRALNRSQIKLSELSQSVLNILEGRCKHSEIVVEKNYPSNEPYIYADGDLLRMAMMNLIVNAIEAMPNGGNIKVSITNKVEIVIFSVADTGGGVRNNKKNIFDAFVSDKPNGVGLGLYLCKHIIERHGGIIKFENAEKGAVFSFELPINLKENNKNFFKSEF